MAFWTSEKIHDQQKNPFHIRDQQCYLINDECFKEENYYNPARVRHGKYELTLSRQVIVTPDGTTGRPACGEGSTLTIPAGQFAILYAHEKIAIPENAIGFISIKFGNTYQGLINISGFHVDPGFIGHLKFSVYNAGNHPIFLDYGSECFQIWFANLTTETSDLYEGDHERQVRVTPADRALMSDRRHSPDILNSKIENIESKVNTIYAVGVVVIVPLLIGLGVAVFDHWVGDKNDLAFAGNMYEIGSVIIVVGLLAGFFGAWFFYICRNFKGFKRRIYSFFKSIDEQEQNGDS